MNLPPALRAGCCADDDGLTDFDALHSRVNNDAAFVYAFDLLLLDVGLSMTMGRTWVRDSSWLSKSPLS
jgi:hypothetical protein